MRAAPMLWWGQGLGKSLGTCLESAIGDEDGGFPLVLLSARMSFAFFCSIVGYLYRKNALYC